LTPLAGLMEWGSRNFATPLDGFFRENQLL
jgi:hypothetical protein